MVRSFRGSGACKKREGHNDTGWERGWVELKVLSVFSQTCSRSRWEQDLWEILENGEVTRAEMGSATGKAIQAARGLHLICQTREADPETQSQERELAELACRVLQSQQWRH